MLLLRSTSRAYFFFRALTTTTTTFSEPSYLLDRLRVLCNRGHLEEAVSLFYTLEEPPSQQSYATLFQACARYCCLHQGQALHHHMLIHNPLQSRFDLYVSNHLINMYAKCGSLEYAHQLFEEMPYRNIVSWTALISGYAQHGRDGNCFSLFSDMLTYCLPTEFAYASVLTLCDGDRGQQVHALALKTSFDAYVYVANALITMYSKNFPCGGEDKDEAWTIFKEMKFRNLITWNSILAGFQSHGLWAEALRNFNLMLRDGIGFDRASLLTVLSSLCGASDIDTLTGLKYCFQLHCLTIKAGYISEIRVTTALTKAYSSLGGQVADCYNIFMETSGRRDIMSWTGIITTFADWDPEESLFLFCQLQQEGLKPDRYTFSIVLKACASLVTERHASAIHSLVIKSGFDNDSVLANSLIHAYGRTGSIAQSKQVFQEMGSRDTVSWNSMLKAYGLHGQAKEALGLFTQMNCQPDEATFVALLSACSHAGMVSEGTQIFDNMVEIHGIVPQLDHYACMVDILGRAGRVVEAEKLINQMPMKPDSVVWSSLLGACRKHGKTHLANLAAAKLKELDPDNSLGYVLMSNIYCSAGSFSEAGHMRKEMITLGVKKRPGLSWAEIGNRVHEFASGGLRHPEGEAVRMKLDEMVEQLKGLGYVAETSLVLHDVEEEHKAEQLYYHSEKLALAFVLTKTGGFNAGGGCGVIRIIKNIRICVDCHNFMKFASDLVQRDIIVRDSNRFHHFRGRLCSCDDYW